MSAPSRPGDVAPAAGAPALQPFPQSVGGGRTRCPAVVRRSRIVQLLRRSGYVQAADLTRILGVSEMTVRRDLDELVRAGHGVRVWGGLVTPALAGPQGSARSQETVETLDRAREHLARAQQAIDEGRVAQARDHVRATLRHLDQELSSGAVGGRSAARA